MATKIVESKFQKAIYDEIKNTNNSIGINAVAGSGKTTTLMGCLDIISPNLDVIMLAFNRTIKEELSKRAPERVTVNTLHGFGCKMIYMNLGSRISVSENKIFNLGCKLFDKWKVQSSENKYSYVHRVSKVVDFMRMNLVFEDNDEILEMTGKYGINVFDTEIEHAKLLLEASNKKIHETIDFVDMIYLPAVKNFKIKKYNFVLVDESQDLNKAQQEMVRKMIHPKNGRLIYVGDPFQSIYSFAGADSDSFINMGLIKENTVQLPLSICYRSTQNIVKHAQEIVPHIQYNPNAEKGALPRDGNIGEITDKSFVLCRNTKPLVILFVQLLKRGLKANIRGKEIGRGIINVIEKTNQKTIDGMLKHLGVNKLKLKKKLLSKGIVKTDKHPQMLEYDEKVEIIQILAERFTSVKLLKDFIDRIFLDENVPGILLSTIHKTKGLEADKVFILLPQLIPSQFATTEEELKQERNLMYVARTRAKKELIYIRDFDIKEQPKDKEK